MRAILATLIFCALCLFAPMANAASWANPQVVSLKIYGHERAAFARSAGAGVVRVKLIDGQIIAVASAYADRFVGFFNALHAREGRLPRITCLAAGHMPGSLHHWGAACDAGQTARNVAAAMMYRVSALAERFGLTDGCSWRRSPDCGHVDVSGLVFAARLHRYYAKNP